MKLFYLLFFALFSFSSFAADDGLLINFSGDTKGVNGLYRRVDSPIGKCSYQFRRGSDTLFLSYRYDLSRWILSTSSNGAFSSLSSYTPTTFYVSDVVDSSSYPPSGLSWGYRTSSVDSTVYRISSSSAVCDYDVVYTTSSVSSALPSTSSYFSSAFGSVTGVCALVLGSALSFLGISKTFSFFNVTSGSGTSGGSSSGTSGGSSSSSATSGGSSSGTSGGLDSYYKKRAKSTVGDFDDFEPPPDEFEIEEEDDV